MGERKLPSLPLPLCWSRRSRAAQKKDPERFAFCEMMYTVCTTHPPVAKGEVMDMRMWQGGIQQGGEQGSQGRDAPEPQGPGEVVLLLQGSRAPDPEGNIQ